jgi:hypothetical protein
VPQSYGAPARHEPQIIADARDALKPLIRAKAEEVVAAMAKEPAFQAAVLEAALSAIPAVIFDAGRRLISEASLEGSNLAMERMQEVLRQRFGQ